MNLPGKLLEKDPSDELNYRFDWSDFLGAASIASAAITLWGSDGSTAQDGALSYDNVALAESNQAVDVRVLGGTRGSIYWVTCQITTNEASVQKKQQSFRLKIRET